MATRTRGGATQTVRPKVPRCSCKPNQAKNGACCTSASCSCRAAARACGTLCACHGHTGGKCPCKNPHTITHRPEAERRRGSLRRAPHVAAFAGVGFSLGGGADGGADLGDTGGGSVCPVCGRRIPTSNLPMHAARCGTMPSEQRRGAPSAAQVERNLVRVEQESEYEAALRADEQKAFVEQQLQQEVVAAARRQRRALEQQEHEREMARQRLGPPPPQDSAQTTHIVIRLLCGRRVSRRFLSSSTLQCLFDFADVSSPHQTAANSLPPSYVLRSHYPQATLTRPSSSLGAAAAVAAGDSGGNKSLESLGLCPNATLFAEEVAMATARQQEPVAQNIVSAAVCVSVNGANAKEARQDPSKAVPDAVARIKRHASAVSSGFASCATSTQVPRKRQAAALATSKEVVDLLSSDDEEGVSTGAAAKQPASTWTCLICTYTGNAECADRCEICSSSCEMSQ